MSKQILRNVRLSFPDLWEARSFMDGEPKFGATLLLPKDDPQAKAFLAEVKRLGTEEFKAGWTKAKNLVSDGDEKVKEDGTPYEGYAGHWAIRVSTKKRPAVVDRDKSALVEADGKPYAGCYVNAVFGLNAFSSQYGKFITGTLSAIQFVGDGEAFGGGASNGGLDDLDSLDDDVGLSPAQDFEPDDDETAPF